MLIIYAQLAHELAYWLAHTLGLMKLFLCTALSVGIKRDRISIAAQDNMAHLVRSITNDISIRKTS